VVWAVAKGSLVNKAILVPAALAISALAPWAITPLLMAGGTFLCFEGCEKLLHKSKHGDEDDGARQRRSQADNVNLVELEATKIKGAIRTDFVLSAEIVTIALGTVATSPFQVRVAVLCGLSVLMTIGVYGLVAAIVKLDDLGLHLQRRGAGAPSTLASLRTSIGSGILVAAPILMRGLSIAGTIAMFLVGGGILSHALPGGGAWVEGQAEALHGIPALGAVIAFLLPLLFEMLVGGLAGMLALGAWSLIQRLRR
jgi:predicted DNA repair protein MutK